MSENFEVGPSDKEVFDQLKYEITPEAARRVYENAHLLQAALNKGHMSIEEARNSLFSLDRNWPYMGQQVTISGGVFRAISEIADENQTKSKMNFIEKEETVSDLEAESKGFFILHKELVDTETGKTKDVWKVCHLAVIEKKIVQSSRLVASQVSLYAACPIDEAHIELPRHKCDTATSGYRPEVIEDINQRLYASGSADNISDEVEQLKGMQIANRLEDGPDYREGLEEYLNHTLSLDQELPQIVAVTDYFYAIDEADQMIYPLKLPEKQLKMAGYITETKLVPISQWQEDSFIASEDDLIWAVSFRELADEKTNKSEQYLIPVDNIADILPVRGLMENLLKQDDI